MDPLKSKQDVIRCTLCETSVAIMYCEGCYIHTCKDCVEKHFSDSSKLHNVVPLNQYLSTPMYPKCKKHPTKRCELHCDQCDLPICAKCISSKSHSGHIKVDIHKNFEIKTEKLQKDLLELEKFIYPKYKEFTESISLQKADLRKNSKKLTKAINKRGEVWHKDIDTVIRNLKSNVEEMESKHLVVLNKQENEITSTISKITQCIAELKTLLNSKDAHLVSEYKSRNAEFKKLPPKLKVSLPKFRPQEINVDQLIEQFGSLSELSFTAEEEDYSMSIQGAESSPLDLPLMDVPLVIKQIDGEYLNLIDVICLNDDEVWTFGGNNMMKLYDRWGELVKSVITKSGSPPSGIAVTTSGYLVYTDERDKTVNMVKNTQIQTIIRLQDWIPGKVCITFSDDLLVTMISDDNKQSKVVRYSGSLEKQTIQFNDKGKPLYSNCPINYVAENRNLDICVSDLDRDAIVVVNHAGKFRFKYTGTPNTTEERFSPRGITTDKQGRILTVDGIKNRIHILDQDGKFLRYVDNIYLECPWGLCVDTRGNLFVADRDTGLVTKVQYCM